MMSLTARGPLQRGLADGNAKRPRRAALLGMAVGATIDWQRPDGQMAGEYFR
jgi:hypothetical protein